MNVEAIGAGATVKFNIPGRNFRLIETTGPVNVTFYRRGAEIAESVQVEAGYSEKWEQDSEGFEQVEFYSSTAQTIKFAVRMESSVSYDRAVGNVAVTNFNGAFLNTIHSVGTASQTLKVSNGARRYLLVQNKSTSGTLWVSFNGGVVSAANGVRLVPGASIEISGYVPTGSVMAIGDIASNPDVIVVEG